MTTKPYPFQAEDVRRVVREMGGRALLSWEPGLGKTLGSLLCARELLSVDSGPVVVVCPASVKYGWRREARKHLGMKGTVLEGRKKQRSDGIGRDLYIVNYDILGSWMDVLKDKKPSLIVIDEAQYVKSRSARRTKWTRELCEGVPHVLALSGTPMTNRPAELWPTLNILRPDEFPSFWSYGMKFCGPKHTRWGWKFEGATRLKSLNRRLKGVMIRRRKRDVLDQLPPQTRTVLPTPLSKPREYRKAAEDFIGWLRTNHGGRASRAVKAEKLTQMGYLRRLAAELKAPAVAEWVSDFLDGGGKLTLFGVHKKFLGGLREQFKGRCVLVDGSVTGRDRQRAVDQFINDKNCRLFLGNIQAAGVGMDGLQKASSTMALGELPWTPGELEQAIARLDRVGQSSPVSVYFLVADGTIEEHLCKVLRSKQKVLDAVLDGGKSAQDEDVFQLLEKALLGKGVRR